MCLKYKVFWWERNTLFWYFWTNGIYGIFHFKITSENENNSNTGELKAYETSIPNRMFYFYLKRMSDWPETFFF